ncbi:uncharacterized protein LOC117182766 [Belonocnema kinseyi]|uniref:uncharacterized protein LOC117182766 n=1 Tax=Belonocnema kinseyi TaxID=2817044 RepID=UPI00143DDDFD|nr:uncharacterized protein LOC117182766 [Belonocnema kinseyi]
MDRAIIKYDNDETLDIKSEFIQDRDAKEITGLYFNIKYESKECTVGKKEDLFADNKKQPRKKKQQIQDLGQENKYKSKKCARSHKVKKKLMYHQKHECNDSPEFTCDFCGKIFKRKTTAKTTDIIFYQHFSSSVTTSLKRNPKYGTKSYNSKISFPSNSRTKTFIKHDNNETSEIKDESFQGQEAEEVTGRSFITKYAVKECN